MSIGKRILTVGTGTALAQIVTAASTPVLTRLFAPDAHAAWAIFFSVCVVMSGLATLRYELAVVLPTDRAESAALYLTAILTATIVCVLAVPLLQLAGPLFLPPNLLDSLNRWSLLIPLTVFSTAIFQVSMAWCTRQADFKTYAIGQFAFPVTMVGCQLIFALAGMRNATGLILGTVIGQVVTASAVTVKLWRQDWAVFRPEAHYTNLRRAALDHQRYPLFMTPYTVVGLFRERLAFFLIGRIGESATVGYYGMVTRLINLPNSFISSAVRPVFFQHATGRPTLSLAKPILGLVRTLGIVGALVWAPCALHVEWLCGTILGEAWRPAAPYALALSIPALPLMMGNWADRMFDVLGRQRTAFFMELGFSATAMTGLLVGYLAFRDLLSAVWVQCVLLAGYYLCWLFVLFGAAGFKRRPLLKVFGQVALCGGLAWLASALIAVVLPDPFALLVSLSLAGLVAAYFAGQEWRRLKHYGTDEQL